MFAKVYGIRYTVHLLTHFKERTMEAVTVFKDSRNNWKAVSEFSLTDDLTLTISTSKKWNGCLSTRASVSQFARGFHCHRMYHDFSRNLDEVKYSRITSKVVTAQHLQCISKVTDLTEAALQHYRRIGEIA